jgi:hypothetical protein
LFFQLGRNKKDAVHVFYEEPARALARAGGRSLRLDFFGTFFVKEKSKKRR